MPEIVWKLVPATTPPAEHTVQKLMDKLRETKGVPTQEGKCPHCQGQVVHRRNTEACGRVYLLLPACLSCGATFRILPPGLGLPLIEAVRER